MLAKGPPVGVDEKTGHTMYAAAEESEPSKPSESKPSSKGPKSKSESAVLDATERGAQTKVTSSTAKSESEDDSYDSTDVNVIRVEGETIKTTERPLTVVPVPFMVPKVVNVDVPVPIMKFDDHFVPVPIRRQIVPKMIFDDKNVYEVECNREKPILVVEERKKPVPVDVPIIIRETDVKVYPIDPHDLSQADMHAMWMRVNADLLDLYRETHAGLNPYGHPSEPKMLPNNFEESLIRQDEQENPAQPLPEGVDPEDPIPLHPGHPLLLPVLQNQWCHIPTTEMQNLYSPDYLRLYNQAMNAIQDPKPQQVNLSETQAARYQPSPDEQLPQPWVHVSDDQYRKMVERKDQAFQAAVEQATAAHFAEAEAEA
ncbi:MAG: uncharacterized protein KVP18_004901 [Porospora cf. gigantea A]|nr:MAG: hypothetical protein KVP18_004901 [Porospora cf. gigantea A]